MHRRHFLGAAGGSLLPQALAGCALAPAAPAWEQHLRGDTLALLGEVHDNAQLHRLRTAALRRAVERGWRPALVMEQFDIDRQGAIEQARAERRRDVQHLIAQAAAARAGWHWPHYEPVIALALEFELPLHAANLPREQAARVVREGADAALGAARAAELGLHAPVDTPWQTAHEHEVEASHCGALPARLRPGMARAQLARDAVMAQVLQTQARHGAVLLAGNGHVRRDIGVPRWMTHVAPQRLLVVGYVEKGEQAEEPSASVRYDARVLAAPALRDDPCAALRKRPIARVAGKRREWS
jgi:uncharacterized iron-regulated protein